MKDFLQKTIHFIKYHNAFAIGFVIVFVGLSATFAASPEARDAVYSKKTKEAGVDNALLLSANISSWDFEPQILNIEQDNDYYYVTYKYRTLGIEDNVWQAVWKEKLLKFEINSDRYSDVSQYITKEIREVIQHENKLLKDSQKIAQSEGRTQRVTVTQYSGLVGKVLNLKPKVVVHNNPLANQQNTTENSTEDTEDGSGQSNRDLIAQIVEEILQQKGLIAQGGSSSNSSSSCSSCTAGASTSTEPTGDDVFVAVDVYATTTVNRPVNIVLKASQSGLSFVVTSAPSHGELSGSEPNMIYTPEDGFKGTDQFTFQAYDSSTHSENAWVYINVAESETEETTTTTATSTESAATSSVPACGAEHLDLCDNQQECEEAEFYWYNDSCNLEPLLICDSEHLNLCTTEIDCQNASGYWYNGLCNLEAQLTCDSSHLDLCSTELDCQSATGYWYNDICNLEACIPDWQCTGWQPLAGTVCTGETFSQTRVCSDSNTCGVETNKPEETQETTGTKDCASATSTVSNP